jgi:hypothetical protein
MAPRVAQIARWGDAAVVAGTHGRQARGRGPLAIAYSSWGPSGELVSAYAGPRDDGAGSMQG